MLKIAVVTAYFPTSAARWEGHSAYQTLRHLAQIAEVHVFCPVVTYPWILSRFAPSHSVDLTWQPPDVKVTYVPCRAIPVLSRPFNGSTFARRLLPHVRRFQPDVILNYRIYPDGFAATRIGRQLGVPVVLTAIGSDLNRIPSAAVGRRTRYALENADFVLTVSRDLAGTACRLGAGPASTKALLNGCDTEIFHPRDRAAAREELSIPDDEKIILYVGRLDVRKGLFELVQAVAELARTYPEMHCYLVGDGPDRAALKEKIVSFGATETISFVAPCPTAEVALWMAASDLVTLPSYNEGCPNVVVEALSSGRPVVATRVGGIPELMDERSGSLVPPKNVAALRDSLEAALRRSWDPAAISGAHSRSWKVCSEELASVLGSLATKA